MIRIKNPSNEQRLLSNESVTKLAQFVLKHFGYDSVETNVFLKEFIQSIPLPMMFSNGITQVWIDKEYISYSYLNEEAVKYVYITQKHIDEEERSYAVINKTFLLPKTIKSEFSSAKNQMKKTNKKYAIFKKRIVKDS